MFSHRGSWTKTFGRTPVCRRLSGTCTGAWAHSCPKNGMISFLLRSELGRSQNGSLTSATFGFGILWWCFGNPIKMCNRSFWDHDFFFKKKNEPLKNSKLWLKLGTVAYYLRISAVNIHTDCTAKIVHFHKSAFSVNSRFFLVPNRRIGVSKQKPSWYEVVKAKSHSLIQSAAGILQCRGRGKGYITHRLKPWFVLSCNQVTLLWMLISRGQ